MRSIFFFVIICLGGGSVGGTGGGQDGGFDNVGFGDANGNNFQAVNVGLKEIPKDLWLNNDEKLDFFGHGKTSENTTTNNKPNKFIVKKGGQKK